MTMQTSGQGNDRIDSTSTKDHRADPEVPTCYGAEPGIDGQVNVLRYPLINCWSGTLWYTKCIIVIDVGCEAVPATVLEIIGSKVLICC